MSHSQEEEETEDLQCLEDHIDILKDTIRGAKGVVSKKEIIKLVEEIKKRVDYMLMDLKGEL